MTSVTCSGCGTPNPAGQKFCGECAAPLPRTCPSCGAVVTATQKFCGECAAPLQSGSASTPTPVAAPPAEVTARSSASAAPGAQPREEERRLVTALFCDMVGFTPISEQLDPEDVRDIQAEYFGAMSRQIEQYGGIVEKYAGDAVLALFGAPVAHEDDAERAVLCALGMQAAIEPVAGRLQARWNLEPAIRVGVNTGEVVSGTWNASGRHDVAVTGDALNTAARIQSSAEPGEVLVGAETMHLTRRRIAYGMQRDLVLKGKSNTVPAFPAVGLREQVGERWEESGYATPLVGRERELAEILDAWTRTRNGDGQLVTLVGDPGVGKSRLAAAALDALSAQGGARVLRARCLSYGHQVSLWLLADLLRNLFSIREADPPDEIRVKVKSAVLLVLERCSGEQQDQAVDVLGEVLGLPPADSVVSQVGPEARRNVLIRSLRLVLSSLTEQSPLLILLEDLHWIDEAGQEIVKEILADIPGMRVLVLVTARPGWNPPWGEWSWPERIALRPLHPADAAALAGAVLGGVTLSLELEQYLAEHAEGNPFFVEELLHALADAGGIIERDRKMVLVPQAAERLPSTLTEILLSRLDRLEAQVRGVVQVGSVIGKSFAVKLLARVMERDQAALELPLTALQQAEIAFPRNAPDLEYVFKHVTMRDVAYNTLVQRRRRELHLQTARAIASLYPSDDFVELIAYHYSRTDEPEAAEWLERAGDRAAAMFANQAALEHYEQARTRLERFSAAPPARARTDEKLGKLLIRLGRYDDAEAVLRSAADLYRAAGDVRGVARSLRDVAYHVSQTKGVEEGIAIVRPLIDALQLAAPSEELSLLYSRLSGIYWRAGRFDESLEEADRAEAIARAADSERARVKALSARSLTLVEQGRPEEGLQVMEEVAAIAERNGDVEALHAVLNNVAASTLIFRADVNRSAALCEQAIAITERIGEPAQTAFYFTSLAEALTYRGEWKRARELLESARDYLGNTNHQNALVGISLDLGYLALLEGRKDDARHLIVDGRRYTDLSGAASMRQVSNWFLGELYLLEEQPGLAIGLLETGPGQSTSGAVVWLVTLARAYRKLGNAAEAEQTAQRARDRLRHDGTKLYEPDLLWLEAVLLADNRAWADALKHLERGIAAARAMPYPYAEARLLERQALVLSEMGNSGQARERLENAVALFSRLGASIDLDRCRAALDVSSAAG